MKTGSTDSFAIQAELRQFDTHPAHNNHPAGFAGWDKDGGWDFEGQLMLIGMARLQLAPVTPAISLLQGGYQRQQSGSGCLVWETQAAGYPLAAEAKMPLHGVVTRT